MCQDLILLSNSYLQINNIFKIYNKNKKLRDKILNIYKHEIPNVEYACENGYQDIMKYHINRNNLPKDVNINKACENGHLNILKFIFNRHIKIHRIQGRRIKHVF